MWMKTASSLKGAAKAAASAAFHACSSCFTRSPSARSSAVMTASITSIDHEHLETGAFGATAEEPLGGSLEVGRLGVRDVEKLLRIAIHQREPGALDLHHDAVTGAESVQHVGHPELDLLLFAGREGLGVRQAVAELAAEGLAPHEL